MVQWKVHLANKKGAWYKFYGCLRSREGSQLPDLVARDSHLIHVAILSSIPAALHRW